MPCCCLRGIRFALLGSKTSRDSNGCLLCIKKYNTILRKLGCDEMWQRRLCVELPAKHLLSSKLRFFFFFKRRCIITGKMFLFFYFLPCYICDGKRYTWKNFVLKKCVFSASSSVGKSSYLVSIFFFFLVK